MHCFVKPITDPGLWNNFWVAHGPGALFQSWDWGEVVLRRSFPLVRLGVYSGSELVGICQVMIVRARRGTYLHVRHGPVFKRHNIAYWQCFLSHLTAFAKTEHAWFLRCSPQIPDTPQNRNLLCKLGFVPSVIHEVDAERCLLLSLDQTKDALLSAMRKTTRYEIRRAEKIGIQVREETDRKALDNFIDLYARTSLRQHFVAHEGITEEFDVFTRSGNAVLLLGYHEETLSSGALILFSGNQAIYHHGASIPTKLPVNYAVQWTAIRMAKARGALWYNFWGVAPAGDDRHPWQGHSQFKRGFGGIESVTINAVDYPVSLFYRLTRAYEWCQERRRGY